MRSHVLAVLLLAATTFAQERVRVAVLPLQSPGVDDAKLVAELEAEVKNILASTQHLTLVGDETVLARLKEEPEGRCPPRGRERLECLERVALTTRAIYAVSVGVKRLGKEYEVHAALADADRVPLNQPDSRTVKETPDVKVSAALKHELRVLLLEGLKMGELPLDPKKRDPEAVAVTSNPPPIPPPAFPPPETRTPPLRLVSYGAAALAVGLGISALGVGLAANGEASGLMLAKDGALPNRETATLMRADGVKTKATAAAVLGGVGVGMAIVAGMLFMTTESSETVVVPAVSGSGAGVVISGRF